MNLAFRYTTSKGEGSISLPAKRTLAIAARLGKTPTVRKRGSYVVGRLPCVEKLVERGLVERRRIWIDVTALGKEACDSLGIQQSYYPSEPADAAPYTGWGPIDPIGYELNEHWRIPVGPALDLRRRSC